MALIKCPECGKEISSFAEMCPNCGCPKSRIEILGSQSSNTPEEDYKEGKKYYSSDENKGLYYLERSANNGHAEAHNMLGLHYMKKDDYKLAFYWWEKGSKLNEVYCLMNAGNCYFNGWGVKKSVAKAVEYWEKSSEIGNATACIWLGQLYSKGADNIPVSNEKSFYWYLKGAKLNDPLGQLGVGLSYLNGWGVEKSVIKAVEFLEKAAEQGNGRAQLTLGIVYDEYPELKENRNRGKMWLIKAFNSKENREVASQILAKRYGPNWML